jgi:hypothetical protein
MTKPIIEKPKRVLTDAEKSVIEDLSSELYTVEYLEHWLNRSDNVFINAPAALNAMGAEGFYKAVQLIVKKDG